jgi:hypothetical protein
MTGPVIARRRAMPRSTVALVPRRLGRIDSVGHRTTGHHAGLRQARGAGWEHLHVSIDDASRLAHTEPVPDKRQESAAGFLVRALAWFARLGVTVERVMTGTLFWRLRPRTGDRRWH